VVLVLMLNCLRCSVHCGCVVLVLMLNSLRCTVHCGCVVLVLMLNSLRCTVYCSVRVVRPRWNVDTNDWQYAESNPSLMFSEFYGQLDAVAPTGIVMLQHDLVQGEHPLHSVGTVQPAV
jgi:hypothetical protein